MQYIPLSSVKRYSRGQRYLLLKNAITASAFSSARNCITVRSTWFARAQTAYNKQICKEPLNHDKFSLIRDPTNCSDNYRRAIPRLITSAPALWSAATITSARRSPRHCFPAPLLGFQFPSINISSTKALAWDSSWYCPLKIVSYGRPCPRNSSHSAGIWRTSLPRKISLGFRFSDRRDHFHPLAYIALVNIQTRGSMWQSFDLSCSSNQSFFFVYEADDRKRGLIRRSELIKKRIRHIIIRQLTKTV